MAQTCLQEVSYYPKIAIGPMVLAQQQESVKTAPTKGDSTGAKVCLRTHVLCSEPALSRSTGNPNDLR
jgi:hypothetical protein